MKSLLEYGELAVTNISQALGNLCSQSMEIDRAFVAKTITYTTKSTGHNTSAGDSADLNGKPWDFEVRTCVSLYHRRSKTSSSNKHNKKKSSQQMDPSSQRVSKNSNAVTLISDLGMVRQIHSGLELAFLLREQLELYYSMEGCYLQISPQGFLCITTPHRRQALYELAGKWPCPDCTNWCKGLKGLWWHQQTSCSRIRPLTAKQNSTDSATIRTNKDTGKVAPSASGSSDHATAKLIAAQGQVGERAMVVYNPNQQQDPFAPMSITTTKEHHDNPSSSSTSIFELASNGPLEAFQNLARKSPDLVHQRDKKGATALLWAAGGGQLAIVQYLIQECACDVHTRQVGKRGFAGRTALHWACRNGHLPVVQYLIAQGANVHAPTADGTTSVCWAAWQNHPHVVEWLLQQQQKTTEGVSILKTINVYGCNPALWAAQGNATTALMQFMESNGCQMGQINSNGHSVLHKAAQRGNSEVAKWFISKYVQNELNQDDGSKDAIEFIAPDGEGCLPSDLAGQESHLSLARWLARKEAELVHSHPAGKQLVQTWKHNHRVVNAELEWGCGHGIQRILESPVES